MLIQYTKLRHLIVNTLNQGYFKFSSLEIIYIIYIKRFAACFPIFWAKKLNKKLVQKSIWPIFAIYMHAGSRQHLNNLGCTGKAGLVNGL